MSINIAFVSTGYYPIHSGGASISTRLIVEQLREAGHEVDVFTTTNEGKDLNRHAADLRELPDGTASTFPRRFGKNYGVVKHSDGFSEYDLVHAYGFGVLPGIVLESDVPVLGTANNLEWICINWMGYLQADCPEYGVREAVQLARQDGYGPVVLPLKLLFESTFKRLARRADQFTVQTPGMRTILGRCGYDTSKIAVVPNLLDPRFKRESRDKNRLIYVGRLVKKKGIEDIVEAYLSLPAEVRERFEFDIYGSGPLTESIRNQIKSQDAITMQYCPYEELPEVYQDASVLAHGSKYPEPFSRTWLEAMASETAIVCSENPSSRTTLNGIAEFYDPFDTDSLQQALRTMLTDQEQRSTIVTRGKSAVSQFSPNKVVPLYISLYKQLKQ